MNAIMAVARCDGATLGYGAGKSNAFPEFSENSLIIERKPIGRLPFRDIIVGGWKRDDAGPMSISIMTEGSTRL